jgi:hypothetical protein
VRVGKLVPESLASSTVLDREGRQILLESFWAEGPAVLVFMRHFGCPASVPRLRSFRHASSSSTN